MASAKYVTDPLQLLAEEEEGEVVGKKWSKNQRVQRWRGFDGRTDRTISKTQHSLANK